MSYRCSACNKVVGPRVARRLHIIYREKADLSGATRKEIAKELPVCETRAPKMEAAEQALRASR